MTSPNSRMLSPVEFESVAQCAEQARDYRAQAAEAKRLNQPSLARGYERQARRWESAVRGWCPIELRM